MPTKSPNKEVFSTLEFEEETRKEREVRTDPKAGRSLDPTKSLQGNTTWKIEGRDEKPSSIWNWNALGNKPLPCTDYNQSDGLRLGSRPANMLNGLKRTSQRWSPKGEVTFHGSQRDPIRWANHLVPPEMGPETTRAYFWPGVNKRPTLLWPGYFLTRPHEIFLTRKVKNWKFGILKGKFSDAKPKPKMADLIRPGSKKFDPDSSLSSMSLMTTND